MQSDINLDFDEADKEDLTVEELKKLIIAEIMKVSHEDFDFKNDFAEELCEDY